MANEGGIQKDIIDYLRSNGHWVYNAQGSATTASGTPDLLCCIYGKFVALEVKDPTGKHPTTPKQKVTMRKIQKSGGAAYMVETLDDVIGVCIMCLLARKSSAKYTLP